MPATELVDLRVRWVSGPDAVFGEVEETELEEAVVSIR